MSIRVKDVLEYPALKKATCVTGTVGMENEVSGAVVMEALDIEEWGRPGLLLLTSYFAMENVPTEHIDLFFKRAKQIGIAGFIFKTERLVSTIPSIFVDSCHNYHLPLIQIDKHTAYEKIINEILESIINRNAYLLQNYHDIHQHFARLMLTQPGINQILENLQDLIQMPVTLLEGVDGKMWGTDPAYNTFVVAEKRALIQMQYMNLPYQHYTVAYESLKFPHLQPVLSVSIPNLGYEEFELIIHQFESQLNDIDFVSIENAAVALQIELVKQYALRQNNQSRLNEMASDLLHGRFSNPENIQETIQDLNLDEESYYRVIIISFENETTEPSQFLPNRFADALINHAKVAFPRMLYVARKERVILIAPVEQSALRETKRKVGLVLDKVTQNQLYKSFSIYTSISNEVNVYHLPEAYRQAFDTQNIIQMTGEPNVIATYEDMGIYQIFAETGNLQSLERFIPQKIWQIYESNPELLETLRVFVDVNQNYSETAQILFVHPKTVRYRVDRLKENFAIDFQNSEEILHYSIALRLLTIIQEHPLSRKKQ